jgi:signal peptidase I
MQPTIKDDQRIFVNKMVYIRFDRDTIRHIMPWVESGPNPETYPFHSPRRGEIIVFHPPGQADVEFIKRVIAIPGDRVELRRGRVIINSVTLDEPYVVKKSFTTETRDAIIVPLGSYYVLGDNRPQSEDSRAFGPVPQENVIGKAWLSYWPSSEWGFIRPFNLDGVLQLAQSGKRALLSGFSVLSF